MRNYGARRWLPGGRCFRGRCINRKYVWFFNWRPRAVVAFLNTFLLSWYDSRGLSLYVTDMLPAAMGYGPPSYHLRVDVSYVDNDLDPEVDMRMLFFKG